MALNKVDLSPKFFTTKQKGDRIMKTKSGLCIALFLALMATSVQAQSTYSLYDDFALKTIDPDKWIGGEYRGGTGSKILELVREIKSGTMHMGNYFYGDTLSNEGSSYGANRLIFPDASGMTGIIGTIQVKAYALNDCSNYSSQTQVRARIGGGIQNSFPNISRKKSH